MHPFDVIDASRDLLFLGLPPTLVGYVIGKKKGAYIGAAFGIAAAYLAISRRANAKLLANKTNSVGDLGLFV